MTIETITPGLLRGIKALANKLGQESDVLANGYSNQRTQHVSELYKNEAVALMRHLKSLDPDEKDAEKMRRKIIGMAYSRAGCGRAESAERKRAVVRWLDGWCVQYGYKHKALNSYTYKELPKLVTQFEAVLNDLLIQI